MLAAPVYTFDLGDLVQLTPRGPAWKVTWRGQLKVHDPVHRVVRRVAVYRLDNGHWDAYYGADLTAVGRW